MLAQWDEGLGQIRKEEKKEEHVCFPNVNSSAPRPHKVEERVWRMILGSRIK